MTYSELKERYLTMYLWSTQESDDNGKVYTAETLDDDIDELEAQLEILYQIDEKFAATLTEEDKEVLIEHAGGLKGAYKKGIKSRKGLFKISFFGALFNLGSFIIDYYFFPRRYREWLICSSISKMCVELEEEGMFA